MRKITQLIATVVLDNLTENAATAYAELLASGNISVTLGIGTSTWPVDGASAIINIIELEETING